MARFSPWVLTLAIRALDGAKSAFGPYAAEPSFLASAAPSGPPHKRGKAKRNHKKAIASRKRKAGR